jgi:hypothetical protein
VTALAEMLEAKLDLRLELNLADMLDTEMETLTGQKTEDKWVQQLVMMKD